MANQSSLVTSLTPTFQGEYARRFDSLCKDLAYIKDDKQKNARIREELEWVESRQTNPIEAQRYRTAVMILSDLLSLSWEIDYSSVGLQLFAPAPIQAQGLMPDEIQKVKNSIRLELSESVLKQRQDSSTQDFIRRMEQPSSSSLQSQPIQVLIADGKELLARLTKNKHEDLSTAQNAINPYLQLVDVNERDEFTGIKLGDIWRYFRLTWSIPYTSIPGRQLLYLVRDAAHPFHAVMGIAALSNSAMQLRDRDDYIGWTQEKFIERLRQALLENDVKLAGNLLELLDEYLENSLNEIEYKNLVKPEELEAPTDEVVYRLRAQVEMFAREREEALKQNGSNEDDEIIEEQGETFADIESTAVFPISEDILELDTRGGNTVRESRKWLILKKRAQELHRLLAAKVFLHRLKKWENLLEALDYYIGKDEFQTVVYSALIANKNKQIGINMLEITTCGAIEPYNHILGGKLVALLMMSPQIVRDYKTRYESQPSLIASQLANRRIVRSCDLVYLGTTSLYGVGSSQYNRLKLPQGTFHAEQPELKYKCIGETSGFGTVQFSLSTSKALSELEEKGLGFRNVNSIFGEGFSPKLRKIRAGLNSLGFDPSVMLKHNQPRLIYAIELCTNARAFLRGETDELPDYIENPQNTLEATRKIVDHWKERWLLNRIKDNKIQQQLRDFKKFSLQLKQSDATKHEKVNSSTQNERLEQQMENLKGVIPLPSNPSLSVEFVQRLYRDISAYSDQLNDNQRNTINIPTPLETFILNKLEMGYSIILTGNAGDGKTHILKQLEKNILALGAEIILDASVVTSEHIIDTWNNARERQVPFCMAANEWPLYVLIRDYVEEFPILQSVREQINNQLVYSDENTQGIIQHSKVIVVDLGKRNHLEKEFFIEALQAVLSEELFEQCARCRFFSECDTTRNRDLLSKEEVVDRFSELVSRLATMGHHVTVRELLSVLSYAVFGGRVCVTLARTSGQRNGMYADQIFSKDAVGTLFELLREYVDPAMISHPNWDIRIFYNDLQDKDWIDSQSIEPSRPDGNVDLRRQQSIFEHLKRRFYFEHSSGGDLLQMLPEDEQNFARLVDPDGKDIEDILDNILQAINMFFCPVLDANQARDKLFVWASQHYDERVPKAFLSKFQIERNNLVIQRPRLANHLRGAFNYHPDHVRLLAFPSDPNRVRWLDIDFTLFKILQDVSRGMPPMLVPEEKAVRLYQFMNSLQAIEPTNVGDRQVIWSYTMSTRELESFTVKRHANQLDL